MTDLDKQDHLDFDVHGLVGIRLIDSSTADIAVVARQIGFLPTRLSREPDIIIQYMDHISTSNLRLLGLNKAGYSDNKFFVLDKSKGNAKAEIPLDRIGQQCEIVCKSGQSSVPLLIAILNLTLLSKGYISLHASAFVFNETGILVTGWAKGGKTEALFAFTEKGARYLGDEWIILSRDGQRMYGIPEPIRLWDWHLDYLPRLASNLRFEDRLVFKTIRTLDKLHRSISEWKMKNSPPAKFLSKAMPALKRQLNVTIPPSEIFGNDRAYSARPDKLFLLLSHQEESYRTTPIDPCEVAQRMIASIQYEQLAFMEYYQAFKFAFPERTNPFLENARKYQNGFLSKALEGKEAYQILHPYPVSFPQLYETMLPHCKPKNSAQKIETHGLTPVFES